VSRALCKPQPRRESAEDVQGESLIAGAVSA